MGCKATIVEGGNEVSLGFTLTMWDVKFYFLSVKSFHSAGFYLNYVGCKVFSGWSEKMLNYIGFTLTMWDVKLKS